MDIYFLEEYAKLYEQIEDGEVHKFKLNTEYGDVYHTFIVREIQSKSLNGYFDIITPYGYGGPLFVGNEKYKQKALGVFMREFPNFCKANNIVSEFIRFHPVEKNHEYLEKFYEIDGIRETCLTEFYEKDNFEKIFSKSARKTVRKSLRSGAKYTIIENPTKKDIQQFIEIYEDTMNRNQAVDYYYFDKSYFENITETLSKYTFQINVSYEEKIIASALYFNFNGKMHAHLSGTLHEFLELSPAYVIKYAAFEYAEKNKCLHLHHGGGTTNQKDDNLLKFKSRFSNKTLTFYTGKKIYNDKIYNQLVTEKINNELIDIDSNQQNFFPLYRIR